MPGRPVCRPAGGRRGCRPPLPRGVAEGGLAAHTAAWPCDRRRRRHVTSFAESPLRPRLGCCEAVDLAPEQEGSEPFVRELCWRDFFHHLLAAFPRLRREDLRPCAAAGGTTRRGFEAWREGLTGYPLVDAGMRQLPRGIHAQLRTPCRGLLPDAASGIDWRKGAGHFLRPLLDGRRLSKQRQLAVGRRHGNPTRLNWMRAGSASGALRCGRRLRAPVHSRDRHVRLLWSDRRV